MGTATLRTSFGDGGLYGKGGRRRVPLRIPLFAAAALLFFVACRSQEPSVTIHTADGTNPVVRVEIADSDEERTKGLMYRTELAADSGMLFLFPEEQPRSFWMKNTPLPLDILFISSDGRIVAIAESTTPFSLKAIPSRAPAERVLEVNAGYVQRNAVKTGDRVTYEGIR